MITLSQKQGDAVAMMTVSPDYLVGTMEQLYHAFPVLAPDAQRTPQEQLIRTAVLAAIRVLVGPLSDALGADIRATPMYRKDAIFAVYVTLSQTLALLLDGKTLELPEEEHVVISASALAPTAATTDTTATPDATEADESVANDASGVTGSVALGGSDGIGEDVRDDRDPETVATDV